MRSRTRTCCTIALFLLVAVAASPARAEPMRFAIDPAASEVTAAVAEPMAALRGSAVGSFRVTGGEISGDSADPASTGHVRITIDAASYASGSNWRDTTVRRDVLEADSFPVIVFESSVLRDVTMPPAAAGAATVEGYLMLHGVTRTLDVPMHASLSAAGNLIADGEVTFKYTDFGMKPPVLFGALSAGDDVTIKFHIVGDRIGPAVSAPAQPSPAAAPPAP